MKKMILTAVMLAAAALCRAQQPAETGAPATTPA